METLGSPPTTIGIARCAERRFQLNPSITEQAKKLLETASSSAVRAAECLQSAREQIAFAGTVRHEIAIDLTEAAIALQKAAVGTFHAQIAVTSAMAKRMTISSTSSKALPNE